MGQMYVSEVMDHSLATTRSVAVNKKKGATVSVKKYGGWKSTFELAAGLAGWP